MTSSQPRDRLLAVAVEQATRGGIADLGLRKLAAAIGTSHRVLLCHFGSREGLLVAVAPVAAAMVQAGASEATAHVDARLGLAVVRGLLLDLLATGDRDGVTEAYERFVRLYEGREDPTAYL